MFEIYSIASTSCNKNNFLIVLKQNKHMSVAGDILFGVFVRFFLITWSNMTSAI